MIIAGVYLFFTLFLIRYNGFFGLFKDESLSKSKLSLLFFLKALAVPAIYLLYSSFYGGIESFDAGVFYHDAAELNNLAFEHPSEYLKALFGLQDDTEGSFFFNNYTRKTFNWDNGRIRLLFYNDNRVVIRLHSLVHFFSFQSYFVHALFSCFISFVGIFWIYRSLKSFFIGREFYLILILCLFPALWIHTGAPLKEGIAVFVMGGMMYSLHTLVFIKKNLLTWLVFIALLYLSLLLKPYLLLYALICFSLFFILQKTQLKLKPLFFIGFLAAALLCLDLGLRLKKNKSLYEMAGMRQVMFSDAAKGGIFLIDSVRFIRLEYDTSLVTERSDKKGFYRIKKNVPYMYWEHSHQQDTMLCEKNLDTISSFSLAYTMKESSSNLSYVNEKGSVYLYALNGLYYTLAHPLFFNANSLQQQLASFENLFLMLGLLLSILGLIFSKKPSLPLIVFWSFALGECLLIAFTSPNTGAIVRYRSPAVVYILLSALYYFDDLKTSFRLQKPAK